MIGFGFGCFDSLKETSGKVTNEPLTAIFGLKGDIFELKELKIAPNVKLILTEKPFGFFLTI